VPVSHHSPVAIGAYAAAGLADANPMRTGFIAWRLGLAGFIVPFMFVYAPEILLEGAWMRVLSTSVSAFIGIFCLASAVEGWMVRKTNLIQRLTLFSASILLIKPGLWTDMAGLILLAVVFIWQKLQAREGGAAELPTEESLPQEIEDSSVLERILRP